MAKLSPLPIALTIAGSDCSAGAGLQADLKTFTHHKVYGLTAVTCVVSEIPGKVSQIFPCSVELVEDQVNLLLKSFPVAAIKTGMLYSKEIIAAVARCLTAGKKRPSLVVDPVMIATSGDPLVTQDAISTYQNTLFPLATLITPNMDEACVLLGQEITTLEDLEPAAEALAQKYRCNVLLKGGHLRGEHAVDILFQRTKGPLKLTAPYIPGIATHGTGCTYSAAIASHLALSRELVTACTLGKRYVTRSIRAAARWYPGADQVDALRHW